MRQVGPQEPTNNKSKKSADNAETTLGNTATKANKSRTTRDKAPAHAFSKEAANLSEMKFLNDRLGKVSSKSLTGTTLQGLGALSQNAEFMALLEEANPLMATELLESNPTFQPQNLLKALGLV